MGLCGFLLVFWWGPTVVVWTGGLYEVSEWWAFVNLVFFAPFLENRFGGCGHLALCRETVSPSWALDLGVVCCRPFEL